MKLTRRSFGKLAGSGLAAAAMPGVFSPAIAQTGPLKIGILAPRSGGNIEAVGLAGSFNPLIANRLRVGQG